jgi:hypothetical protein
VLSAEDEEYYDEEIDSNDHKKSRNAPQGADKSVKKAKKP